jgi:diguanylate cyclase (GGDEF) domain
MKGGDRMSREIVNSVLLLWGSLFCAVSSLYFWITKNYRTEKRDWIYRMQVSTSVLLFWDAMTNLFRGRPDLLGFWMVRISNFFNFFLVELTLLFFHYYICAMLLTPEENAALKRVKAVRAVCCVGLALVVVSQFTGLYYTFDASNVYHRTAWYPISMIVPVVAMALDGSLLLQYRARISRGMFLATGSYLVLPLLAISIQIVHYGLALVDLAIGVAMVLMFLVSIKEQNEAMLRLETSRAQIAEKLEIATVLNRCVEKLSPGGQDLDKATNELLGVISDYFAADRSYIFELDRERNVIVNTHEAVREGVSEEKDNLQEVPLEAVAEWIEAFEREGVYFLPDLEQKKGQLIYDVLAPQNIHTLLAVPLLRDHVVTGILGVDNPKEHVEDATLLSSIQFFVTNSLEQKKTQERLYKLCYIDMLTGLFNRNRYMEDLSGWEKAALTEIGGIYMDLNGLKHCNDRFGHEAGDALIRRTADALNEVFPGEGYRIGGDEFVVLRCPIGQEDFADKVHQLREALVRHGVDAAIGSFWQPLVEDLPAFLREADDRMYREKERQKRSARPSV